MKKIYMSLVALTIASGVMAQSASVVTYSKIRANNNGVVAIEQPGTPPSVAAAGDTINSLYYDFSTPSNWTFGNTSSDNADWAIGTTGATGSFSSSYGQLASTTAANGWAVFDGDGLGSASSIHDAWVQLANPVDLTGFPSVAVSFQQYNVKFTNSVYLEVSTDGGSNWTQYEVSANQAPNSAGDNPEIVNVNISGAVAANPATVWIRFRFIGTWDYAWHVDDVAFVEGASNDIQMTTLYHGDIIEAFEYQLIPLNQSTEVVIGAISTNGGGSDQTNLVYTYDISNGSGSVDSGTFPASNTVLASTEVDTTWYATGFTPTVTGDYTLTVSVASDEADENPNNNEMMSEFVMSDYLYGHDDEPNIEFQVTGTDANGDTPEFKIANYYEVLADQTLYSVQVAFGNLTTTESVFVEVYDLAEDPNLEDPLINEIYDFQPGDIPTGGEVILVDIPVNDGLGEELLQDNVYLVAVANTGAGEELYVLASDGDDDRAQLRYGPFGQGGAVNWYTGYTTSPVIRMNFEDNPLSIQENEDITGLNVYPNPAADNLTVKFVSKEDQDLNVNVISATGAIVTSEQLTAKVGQSNKLNFDVRELSTGIYMVQIQGATSTLTKRVVVQ